MRVGVRLGKRYKVREGRDYIISIHSGEDTGIKGGVGRKGYLGEVSLSLTWGNEN